MRCTKLKMLTSKYDNPLSMRYNYISCKYHFQDFIKKSRRIFFCFLKAGEVYQSALPLSQFLTAIMTIG